MTGRLAETLQLTQPKEAPAADEAAVGDAPGGAAAADAPMAEGTDAAPAAAEEEEGEEEDGAAGDGGGDYGFAEQQGAQYPAVLALAVSPSGCAPNPGIVD